MYFGHHSVIEYLNTDASVRRRSPLHNNANIMLDIYFVDGFALIKYIDLDCIVYIYMLIMDKL